MSGVERQGISMSEVYITHPVTGEHMDKSQCKRVITQLYECVQEMDVLIKDRDQYINMIDKLTDAVAEHFEVDLGEISNINDPYENALEWLDPVRALKNKDAFICGHCNARLGDWNYCAYCGQQLKWDEGDK